MSDVVGRIERREPVAAQELFDFIVGKVIAQGRRSEGGRSDGSSACLYRGPEGLKCAVGHAIPDSLYRADMEGANLTRVAAEIGLYEHYTLLRSLQDAHDNCEPDDEFVAGFKSSASAVAKNHDLKFNF